MRRQPILSSVLMLVCLAVWPVPLRAAEADTSYFMIVFSGQRDPNAPQFSHTFATFVKAVRPKDANESQLEIHTISWISATLNIVILADRPEPGTNLDLAASLRLAVHNGDRISMWGPYLIRKELYDRALKQEARLKSGAVKYKAIDDGVRPQVATNCIHAVSDIDADNGYLQVGTARGEGASQMVADHLKRWIIEPGRMHAWLATKLGLDQYAITKRGLNP